MMMIILIDVENCPAHQFFSVVYGAVRNKFFNLFSLASTRLTQVLSDRFQTNFVQFGPSDFGLQSQALYGIETDTNTIRL